MADGTNNAAAELIKLELAGGTVVEGKTAAEIQEKLGKMYGDTRSAYQQEKAKREELEAKLSQITSVTTGEPAAPTDSVNNEFWQQINEGKVGPAIVTALASELGMKPDEFVPYVKNTFERTEKIAGSTEIGEFMRMCPDFPGTKEASDMLITTMDSAGIPRTAEGMKRAYHSLVYEKKIEPLPLALGQPGPGMPPPPIGGAGAPQATPDQVAKWNSMTTEQLAEEGRKLGIMGR